MSQSPADAQAAGGNSSYLDAWQQLALRIQNGQSFSGRERNCCFLNTRSARFADVSSVIGLDLIDDARAVAVADWDHDGDLDLWLTNRTAPRVRFLRNDLPTDHHFLALRLTGDPGRNCPRDAVGARIELRLRDADGNRQRRLKTLTAGDAFLSQSTKWVHFGIDASQSIESLAVRWPGSAEMETWSNLRPNTRYHIQQGQLLAVPQARRDGPLGVSDEHPIPPAEKETARLWFASPPTVEPFAYRDLSSGDSSSAVASSRPRLICLWASWCAPCGVEMRQLNEHYEQLRESGLEILALSVEALAGVDGDAAQASRFAQRMELKYPTGLATEELVEHLDELRRAAVYRQDQLPLPSSFLIDERGHLRAVYAGPVSIQQLSQDMERLKAVGLDGNLQHAVPFVGRWSQELYTTHPIAIASIFREEKQFDDAVDYLQRFLAQETVPAAGDQTTAAVAARRRLADVHYMLGRLGLDQSRADDAADAFSKSIGYAAGHLPALLGLADLYVNSQRYEQAIDVLEQAGEHHAADPRVLNLMGLARLRQARPAEAVEHFQAALRAKADYIPAANNLAWLRATCPEARYRDGRQAVELAKASIEQIGKRPDILDTLAAAYAEAGDYQLAVRTAEEALARIAMSDHEELARQIRSRVELYRKEKPFRDRIP